MLDIIAFLIEQYLAPEDRPDRGVLARRLAALGFEEEEIGETLDALAALEAMDPAAYAALDSAAPRLLSPQEAARLTLEAQSFLHYLGNSGALSFGARELLLDLLLRVEPGQIDLETLQRMALLLLWRQGNTLANMLIETLLYGDEHPALQ
jgi:Smg protein